MFYAKSTNSFYDFEIHGENIPDDSVEISNKEYSALLEGQSNGMIITAGADGHPILQDRPAPTVQQTVDVISNAIQASLNNGAKLWGYTNMVYAASYAASTNPQYAADAAALIQWRDDVWDWAIPKFADVTPGETPDEFLANMPKQPAQPKP